LDYVNVEKKRKDFINGADEKHEKESGFKAFNRFLRRWESIRPPVRRDY
jgi:hypothetical protein